MTEIEYADLLINKYNILLRELVYECKISFTTGAGFDTKTYGIRMSILDVSNTIETLKNEYKHDGNIFWTIEYYSNVLIILKNK